LIRPKILALNLLGINSSISMVSALNPKTERHEISKYSMSLVMALLMTYRMERQAISRKGRKLAY